MKFLALSMIVLGCGCGQELAEEQAGIELVVDSKASAQVSYDTKTVVTCNLYQLQRDQQSIECASGADGGTYVKYCDDKLLYGYRTERGEYCSTNGDYWVIPPCSCSGYPVKLKNTVR